MLLVLSSDLSILDDFGHYLVVIPGCRLNQLSLYGSYGLHVLQAVSLGGSLLTDSSHMRLVVCALDPSRRDGRLGSRLGCVADEVQWELAEVADRLRLLLILYL